MLKSRGERDLALESHDRNVGRHLGRQHFHDDLPLESRLVDEKDARHSPTAELSLDGIIVAERSLKLRASVSGHADLLNSSLIQLIG
jgi:hypothetical protein